MQLRKRIHHPIHGMMLVDSDIYSHYYDYHMCSHIAGSIESSEYERASLYYTEEVLQCDIDSVDDMTMEDISALSGDISALYLSVHAPHLLGGRYCDSLELSDMHISFVMLMTEYEPYEPYERVKNYRVEGF